MALEWQWDRAQRALSELNAAGAITSRDYDEIRRQNDAYRTSAHEWSALLLP